MTLSINTTLLPRFVLGEVVAAVLSVHELGFSFNDLKPENVLITELGHVKVYQRHYLTFLLAKYKAVIQVADFGACRPVTEEAKRLLQQSKHVLANARNGDWKESSGEGEEDGDAKILSQEANLFENDDR